MQIRQYTVLRHIDTELVILGVDAFDVGALFLLWASIFRVAKNMPSIELTKLFLGIDIVLCLTLFLLDRFITKRRGLGWLLHAEAYNRIVRPKGAFEMERMPEEIAAMLK